MPETIKVDPHAIVEAFAHLYGAYNVWVSLADGTDIALAEPYLTAACGLFDAAFGEGTSRDYTNPVLVEAEARAHEVTAEILDSLAARASDYRGSARRMREAGRTDVPFRVEDDAPAPA